MLLIRSLLVACAQPASAQPFVDRPYVATPDETDFFSYHLDEWTVDDGLPGHLSHFAQDPDGYLWITTWEGLVRFDGHRFVVYNQANTPAFSTQAFTRIYVSHAGDLWFGAQNGMIYQRKDGIFIPHDVLLNALDGWINAFAEDAKGRLWVATSKGAIAYFDGKTWMFHPQRLHSGWPFFVADANGRIWTYLPETSQQPSPFIHLDNGVLARLDNLSFLPQPSTETVGFVKTQHGPLFHRPRGSIETYRREGRIRMDLLDAQGTLLGWYWHTPMAAYCLLVDRRGRAWVLLTGPEDAGTLLVYKDGDLLAQIKPKGTGWIDAMLEDDEGNVWFKARGGGLFRAQITPFVHYLTDDGVVRHPLAVSEAPDGRVLVSSRSGVNTDKVTVFQGATLSNRRFRLRGPGPDHSSTPYVALGHVVVDAKGRWWGLSKKHLLRLHNDTAESVWHSDRGNVRFLYVDPARPDYLWLGTTTGALFGFNTRTLKIEEAYQVGTTKIVSLFRDSQGRLWIGQQDQLARLEHDGTVTVFDDDTVSRAQIQAFYEDAEATLWIGTHGKGLVRYRNGRMHSLCTNKGLVENTVTSIFEDAEGFFWLSSNLGLQRVRRDDLNAVLDDRADWVYAVGLPQKAGHLGVDPGMQRALQDHTGALWYPSLRGITRVDPAIYQTGFTKPPVVKVEEIVTEKGIYGAQSTLTLSPDERRLTIAYEAISLGAPDLLHFRFRLEGLDATWIEAGSKRSASYAHVKPGHYTFRVQAMNGGGVWSEEDAVFTFTVQPFFYETTWFYLLCGLGLLALGVAGFSYRLRHYKRKHVELDQLVRARTHELAIEKQNVEQALQTVAEQSEQLQSLDEAKSRFFANISHEFRTPLLLILGPLEDLRDGVQGALREEAREQVALAHRNGRRLLRLVNQLLDVSRLETGRLTLQAQLTEAVAFVKQVAGTFASMAKRKGIDFHVEVPDEPLWVYFDPDQMEKVLTNLLGNAFKFSPQKSAVTLRITTEDAPHNDSYFVVTVQDTGPGIAPEHLPHLFERFYQADASSTRRQPGTGIGLALAKELVTLHHGKIDVESEEGKGSTFTVRLPLGHAHFAEEELAAPAAAASPLLPDTMGKGTSATTGWLNEIEGVNNAAPGDKAAVEAPAHAGDDVTTVLVVDDNPDVRAYMRRHLEEAYRVVEAMNGRTALEQTRSVLPDLIISDVMMPEMDGFSFCKALKQDPELDFIPIILLTAKASPESKILGLQEGADDYLTKPFNVRELIARVENLIASRQCLKARLDGTVVSEPTVLAYPDRSTLTTHDHSFFDQFQLVLEEHLSDENMGVNDLAEAMGLSRSTLYRRVHDVFQQSPMELLWQVRLQHAAQLLTQPDINVSEVAYGVGFRSVAHFSTRFSEHFGVTPSAFRTRSHTGA